MEWCAWPDDDRSIAPKYDEPRWKWLGSPEFSSREDFEVYMDREMTESAQRAAAAMQPRPIESSTVFITYTPHMGLH